MHPIITLFFLLLTTQLITGRTKNVADRGLISEEVSYTSILREQSRFHSECSDEEQHFEPTKKKNFNGTTLAYITPWNNKGYDIAKIFACKFDYISPVWFNIRGSSDGFIIDGDHNVDKEWIGEVKGNECPESSTNPKMVPRYLFDGWNGDHYNRIFSDKNNDVKKLVKQIISSCKKHSFDGIVLEGGSLLQIEYRRKLIPFYKSLGSELRKAGFKFVLVQAPKRDGSLSFTSEEHTTLSEDVDFFSLMTYDYSNNQPGPNSPLSWSTSAVLSLLSPEQREDQKMTGKILMGIPLYGYHFVLGGQPKHILGRDYLSLLKKAKPEIEWEESSKEHKFAFTSADGKDNFVYYPSLKFIQERLEMAQSLGTGISLWEIGQGLDYFFDLL